jgi:hypothetical protein
MWQSDQSFMHNDRMMNIIEFQIINDMNDMNFEHTPSPSLNIYDHQLIIH